MILNIPTFYEKTDLSKLLYSPSLLLPYSPVLHQLNGDLFLFWTAIQGADIDCTFSGVLPMGIVYLE